MLFWLDKELVYYKNVINVNERLILEQQFYNTLLSKLEYMPDPGSSYTSQIQKEVKNARNVGYVRNDQSVVRRYHVQNDVRNDLQRKSPWSLRDARLGDPSKGRLRWRSQGVFVQDYLILMINQNVLIVGFMC